MTVEKINSLQPTVNNLSFKQEEEIQQSITQSKGSTKDVVTALSVLGAIGAAGIAIFKHKSSKEALKKLEQETKQKIAEAEEKAKKAAEDVEKKIQEAVEQAKADFKKSAEEVKQTDTKPNTTEKVKIVYVPTKEVPQVKPKINETALEEDIPKRTIVITPSGYFNKPQKENFFERIKKIFRKQDKSQNTTEGENKSSWIKKAKEKFDTFKEGLRTEKKSEVPAEPKTNVEPKTPAEPKAQTEPKVSAEPKESFTDRVGGFFKRQWHKVKGAFERKQAVEEPKVETPKTETTATKKTKKNKFKAPKAKTKKADKPKVETTKVEEPTAKTEPKGAVEPKAPVEPKESLTDKVKKQWNKIKGAFERKQSVEEPKVETPKTEAPTIEEPKESFTDRINGFFQKQWSRIKSRMETSKTDDTPAFLPVGEDHKIVLKPNEIVKNEASEGVSIFDIPIIKKEVKEAENIEEKVTQSVGKAVKKGLEEYKPSTPFVEKMAEKDLLAEYNELKGKVQGLPVTDPIASRFLEVKGELLNHRSFYINDGEIIKKGVNEAKNLEEKVAQPIEKVVKKGLEEYNPSAPFVEKMAEKDLLAEYNELKGKVQGLPVADPIASRFLEVKGELLNHRSFYIKDGEIIKKGVNEAKNIEEKEVKKTAKTTKKKKAAVTPKKTTKKAVTEKVKKSTVKKAKVVKEVKPKVEKPKEKTAWQKAIENDVKEYSELEKTVKEANTRAEKGEKIILYFERPNKNGHLKATIKTADEVPNV